MYPWLARVTCSTTWMRFVVKSTLPTRSPAHSPQRSPRRAPSQTMVSHSGPMAVASPANSAPDGIRRSVGCTLGSLTPRHGDLLITSSSTADAKMARRTSYWRRTLRGAFSVAQTLTRFCTSRGVIEPRSLSPSTGSR